MSQVNRVFPKVALALLATIAVCVVSVRATSYARRFPTPSAAPHALDDPLTVHSVGGGPDGGAVFSLAIVATQPATVFAAFEAGGVFKTASGGATWTPADRGLPDAAACDLVADPVDPVVLYATCAGGLFKTTNSGTTWQQLDVDDAESPLIAPSNARIVYELPSGVDVVRSMDGGRHWAAVRTAGLAGAVFALAIDPSNASVLFGGTSEGVFKSRDGGLRWTLVNRGMPIGAEVRTLAIDPTDPDTAYAGTSTHGLFETRTGGIEWFPTGDGLSVEPLSRLTFADTSPSVLFATQGSSIMRSVDAGGHWQPLPSSPSGQTEGHFVVDPFSPSTLYVGTSVGVFMTTDLGEHWTSLSRGITRATASVVWHEGDPSAIFSQANGGTFTSLDGGTTWRPLDARGAFPEADVTFVNSDGAFGVVAHTRAGDFVLRRGQTEWAPVPVYPSLGPVKASWVAPSDRDVVYATTADSLFTSADGGRRWTDARLPNGERLNLLGIAWRTPLVAYANPSVRGFYEPSEIWRTVNGGKTWDHVHDCDLQVLAHSCLPITDPNDVETIFVVVEDVGLGAGNTIQRTIDGGATWTEMPLPALSLSWTVLPTVPTTLLSQVFDLSDAGRYIVLKSTDRGEHWAVLGTGLPPNAEISGIVADSKDPTRLYAGTRGRGVFRSLNSGATWEPAGSVR